MSEKVLIFCEAALRRRGVALKFKLFREKCKSALGDADSTLERRFAQSLCVLVLKFSDLTSRTAGHVESKLKKEGAAAHFAGDRFIRSKFYYVGLGLKVNSFYNNVCAGSSGSGIM